MCKYKHAKWYDLESNESFLGCFTVLPLAPTLKVSRMTCLSWALHGEGLGKENGKDLEGPGFPRVASSELIGFSSQWRHRTCMEDA